MALIEVQQASRLIFVDELTSLYNRRFMREYIRDRLDGFVESRTPIAVLMLDLDGFKQINDTFGHLEGDHILQRLAGVIQASIPPESYAIRYAGDEFLVFVEGSCGDVGVEVAEAILAGVSEQPFPSDKVPEGIPVRLSIGVAACPDDATTAAELIEAADKALYRSKSLGKNRVTLYGTWNLPPAEQVLRRIPCPRIAGRSVELRGLDEVLPRQGADARHRFCLLEGQRGVGKSRLLSEVMQRARRTSLPCSYVRCLESYQSIPYKSLMAFLAESLNRDREQVDAARTRLSGPALVELGELIPELRDAGDQLPRAQSAEERRRLLFHGMADLVESIAENAPFLLLLDDIHYVDEASLELLYRLQDRTGGSLVVIAAGRDDCLSDLEGSPALGRLFAALREAPSFSSLSVEALTLAEIEEMIEGILPGGRPSRAFVERLFQASGGLPLHVQEALKGLVAKGLLRPRSGTWDLEGVDLSAIPSSLEAAVHSGMETLDGDTCDMISRAAVVGPHASITTLSEVLGKNAGETRELVERGKKHRVFENSSVDAEEVRFLSQCFQQIVYSDLDGEDRRRAHQRVGEVTEGLAGGDVDSGLLGLLAHHFQRSNDRKKADVYGKRVQEVSERLFSAAEVAAEMDLSVAVSPRLHLDDALLPRARTFAKCLATAVTNMKLYPDGSELVSQASASALASLSDLLGDIEEISLAEQSGRLLCNGRRLDSGGEHQAIERLLQLYRDHGVRRCTFDQGVRKADLEPLLRLLAGSIAGEQRSASWWTQELSERGVEHIRVFPVLYLKLEAQERTWTRERVEERLDETTLILALDFLRALTAMVDNLRLYPAESELVRYAADRLEEVSGPLLEHLPSLTFSATEDTILVNAVRPNLRQHRSTVTRVKELLKVTGLKTLTVKRGLTREAFLAFLARLTMPVEAAERGSAHWRGVLLELGITTIDVESRTYAAAQQGTVDRAQDPETEFDELRQRVDHWLAAPLDEFLGEEAQAELTVVLGRLCALDEVDLARRIVVHTTSAMLAADEGHRTRAAEILADGARVVQDGPSEWVTDVIIDPLTTAVEREDRFRALRRELELAALILSRLIREGELRRGVRLVHEVAKASAGASHLADSIEPIGGVVDAHRESLLRLILDGDDVVLSRAAATLLRVRGNATARLLTSELHRAPTFDKVRRILSVIELVAPTLGTDLFFLLRHPDVQIRAEMVRAIRRFPEAEAQGFLTKALSSDEREVVLGALDCIHGVGGIELAQAVMNLLDRALGDHVSRVACQCLGAMKATSAVPSLLRVLERRPRFFGLVRGLPATVRAAAAASLGECGTDEIESALDRATKDRSVEVSRAAQLAIEQIRTG